MNPIEAYDELLARSKDLAYLVSSMMILNWDQRTQIPPQGHPHRVGQLTTLARVRHQWMTDPRIGELLAVVEGSALTRDPLSVEAVNIREWRRTFDRITKIPERLAVEITRAAAEGQAVWEQARPANDWLMFRPYLERIVALKQEEAEALGYENEPYDALLDGYEQGETAGRLEPLLKGLCQGLVALLDRLMGAPRRPVLSGADLRFPVEAQVAFAKEAARQIGYDLQAGRMDVSAHPFTSGIGPGDVRITSRYSEDSLAGGFFAVIHESGHAMYHQGLPLEHWGGPFCRPASLGINESQSRMWENMVGRSSAFWEHFYPLAQERFWALRDISSQDFLRSINQVSPSLIRVEADEVTYNVHILIRFELEAALTRKDIQVSQLPEAWNQKMEAYLGVTPPNDALGVMQDVHWSQGSIGYFPTYTLGNLYAAQFMTQATRDLERLDDHFTAGDFAPLLHWLRAKIHSQGTRYLPRDLVRNVTGEDLNPDHLVNYLTEKYETLYGL